MGPKKKEPPEGGGSKDVQGKKETKGGGGKGDKGRKKGGGKDEEILSTEKVTPEELPPGELPGPPPIVTPEFTYNKELTLEQLQTINALSANLEDAARSLAVNLGLGDCVFDARNLILLEYCLGNLMFAKNAGLTLKQSLVIYDLGHMILDLIREGNAFADAERLFRNRLLSLSLVQYKNPIPVQNIKEEKPKDAETVNEVEKANDDERSKDTKKSKGAQMTKGSQKPKDGSKKVVELDKQEEAEPGNVDKKEETDNADGPLFSPFDLQKIIPYFTTTVFQHYCLYQYCFTQVHYNITRDERVFVETAMTYPLSEAKSQEEVDAEEAARVAAAEKARQNAYAAEVRAAQDKFDSLTAEAARLAEEELNRRALTLDEYIDLAVRQKIESAKKALLEEYEYREQSLIDKMEQMQKNQAAAAAAADAIAARNAIIAAKTVPPVGKASPTTKETPAKKKGK